MSESDIEDSGSQPTAPPDGDDSIRGRVLPAERMAVALAFAWLFFLLLGYFIVRPLRETMSTIVGTESLQNLFLASFGVMLCAVPVYSGIVAILPRRWLVRIVFHFFAICLCGFWLLMRSDSSQVQTWSAYVFFVWVSVFGVFATSVFWSVLADMFSNNQGKRLFGLIASGGTIGAITGSLVASQLASQLSSGALLLIPAAMIEMGLWCAWRLETYSDAIQAADPTRTVDRSWMKPTGGGLLAGITHVARSPYLAMICLFLLFIQLCGTQLYFEQAEIVDSLVKEESDRTQYFAYLDLAVQLVTLLVQVGLSSVVLRRFGVAFALLLLPVIYALGFASLATSQTLLVLAVTVIAARSAGYGIAVPAREVLFTVVSREDKYKSKSFIDTVVLRGGDALSGQLFASLRGLGFGLAALNLIALPVTVLWAIVAILLGRKQRMLARSVSTTKSSGELAP